MAIYPLKLSVHRAVTTRFGSIPSIAVMVTALGLAAPRPVGADVIVDDGDPGTVTEETWAVSTGAGAYGSSYHSRSGYGRYHFVPALVPGRYRVYLWWAIDARQSIGVPVTIQTHSGPVNRSVNQSLYGGKWNLLGTFDLDPVARVTIAASGTAPVCADAARFEPIPPSNPPPFSPTGLTATPGGSSISLDWNDNPESDRKGYSVYRRLTAGGDYVMMAREITASAFVDSRLLSDTGHTYCVIASDTTYGLSLPSAEVSAVSPAVPAVVMDDGGPGTTPVGTWIPVGGANCYGGAALYAQTTGSYTFTPTLSLGRYRIFLWWDVNLQLSSSVTITIRTASTGVTRMVNQSAGGGRWNYVDVFDLGPGSYVRVPGLASLKSCADAVRFERIGIATIDKPPSAPAYLVATAGNAKVHLDWRDNPETDLASYSVYRSTISGSGFTLLAAGLTVSSYDDLAVVNGTTYYYRVHAVDVEGQVSSPSAQVLAKPLDLPPAKPLGLVATRGDRVVHLDWSDNPESDLASYSVYRSTISGSGFALLVAGLTSSTYDDRSVVNGTTYYYTVFAVDIAGQVSASSAQVSATPIDLPPAAPAGLAATPDVGIVRLDWSDNTEVDLASYSVYRSTTSGTGYLLLAAGLTASRYDDLAVVAGTTYYYIVKAVDLGGNVSVASPQVSGRPLMAVASLSWDPPILNQDGTPLLDLAGYKVYRGTQSGVYGTVVNVGMTTSYVLNLSPGTYFFRVTAYDTLGNESVLSNEATFTHP